ncbi:MAG: PAS domain S-box protein, partial [Bacteroidota bacterium]
MTIGDRSHHSYEFLFSLSLSFGDVLELEESCRSFLEAVHKHPNCRYGGCWIKVEQDAPHCVLYQKKPTKNKTHKDQSAILDYLGRKQYALLSADEPLFAQIKHRKNVQSGCYHLFRLKQLGFLVLYTKSDVFPLEPSAFRQLTGQLGRHLTQCWEKERQDQQIHHLQEINQRSNLILESIGEGYILADKDLNIVYVNDQICEMSGYKRDEIVGYKVFEIMYDWEKTNQFQELIVESLKGQTVEFEDWHIHKQTGEKWWALIKIRPIRDAAGEHIGNIATIIDVTELTEARLDMKMSEARYRSLFETAFDGIIVFDGNTEKPISCNKKALDYFQMTEEEFLNASPLELSPVYQSNGQRSEDMRKRILKKLNEEGQVHYEWTHLLPDGSPLHTEISSFQLPLSGQKHRTVLFRDITERKKTQEALRENEERLSLALEAGQLGTWDWNIKTGETVYNRRWAEMLGYELDEIQPNDKSFNELVHPDDLSTVLDRIQEHLDGKTPFFELEARMIAKDGSIKWIYDLGKVTAYDRENTPLRATGIHIDISRMKQSEQIIRESEQRFRQLFEALQESEQNLREAQQMANLGSWTYDLRANTIEWTEEIYRLFELDPSEAEPSYDTYLESIHPEDRPKINVAVDRAIATGQAYELNLRHYGSSGKLFYTIARGKPIYENGQVVKLVGTAQDVTNQKLAEEAILETNRKYIDLFENMYDALIITNAEGRFIDANKAAQKMLGYELDELTQLRIPEVVHPDDIDRSQRYLQQLIDKGFYSNYEGRIITKSGKIRYLQVNSNAIYRDGEFSGSRDIARDVTELKEAEQKREKLLQELEEVNQELKDFAYVVSHDLKAPLRAIGSLSHWISEDYKDVLDQSGRQQLDLLVNRVNRMHNFIEGILEYSRIGRIKIDKEKVALGKMVDEICDTLDVPDSFDIAMKEPLPIIFAERIRMEQLFQNLISNAIKYNDKAKGQLRIGYLDIGEYHQFRLADNGPGIEEKYHEKIFQIFQTLQARDKFESTGIGLTIVKRIVQHYGGKIKVTSSQGMGTTF